MSKNWYQCQDNLERFAKAIHLMKCKKGPDGVGWFGQSSVSQVTQYLS